MTGALRIEGKSLDDLKKAIVAHCQPPDLRAALERYPGLLGEGDALVPGETLRNMLAACVDSIKTESEAHVGSFLLRVIEHRWKVEALRREALVAVPILVRAPRDVAAQTALVAEALKQLAAALPEDPGPGRVGDPLIFSALCEIRVPLIELIGCLEAFAALKGLHDALHNLQVLGAGWLDVLVADDPSRLLAADILGLLQRALVEIDRIGDGLPDDGEACRERCQRALLQAKETLVPGGPDKEADARGRLRALLAAEMPLIDEILFGKSRDLPLKAFTRALTRMSQGQNLDQARDAAIDLADTLRRRLMEHAVWQSADLRLYQLEDCLTDPVRDWFEAVVPIVTALRTSLRAVAASPDDVQSLTGPMTDALTLYERALRPNAPKDASEATFSRVVHAFTMLRADVRGSFYEIDRLMKADFERCLLIKEQLQTILTRVPMHCGLWVDA